MAYDPAIHERTPTQSRSYLSDGYVPDRERGDPAIDHDLSYFRRPRPDTLPWRRAYERARTQAIWNKRQQLLPSVIWQAFRKRLPYRVPTEHELLTLMAEEWLYRTDEGRATQSAFRGPPRPRFATAPVASAAPPCGVPVRG